jgi:nucleotide-binding universal stress UspA family protein
MQLNKIFVPVDGSDHSMRAAEYALELARLMDAEIVLIHCHRPFPVVLGEPYFQKAINKIMEKSNQLLDPYRKLFRESGVRFTERILEGPAGDVISDVAEIEKADMIIMGSRGHSDLKGLFLGSVAHRVLHSAPCPVLVIR